MVNEIFNDAKSRMVKAIEHFMHEISQIRTGRASTNLLDNIKVDYYGVPTPLKNIAHVSVPDPQLLLVQPFDPTSLESTKFDNIVSAFSLAQTITIPIPILNTLNISP